MDHRDGPISDTLDMLSRIRHRGPDQVGVYINENVWQAKSIDELARITVKGRISLGQSRLEIVGGAKGVQPISGEKLTIVHNGEIYNHQELRELLRHHTIVSESDSEILLHLIEDFYEDSLLNAVKKAMPFLDGMYAFAVTDGKSLVLARDPVGEKPIYFTDEFPFYFASERKALIKGNGSIKRLSLGKVLEVSENGIRIETGYQIEKPPIEIKDLGGALIAYETAFNRAIEKRVAGLDRVGVLFSGGIDSVLVSRAVQLTGCDVTCYSVGAENSVDIEMALRAARELGLRIKVEYLREELIERLLPEIIEAIELNGLIQVEAAIPMYIAAKMCREDNHKVMFTGQAADELFAGYSWYNEVIREKGHLALHDRLWDDIEKLYIDTLEREDRMTMAHSIELRAPFLDRQVIRTAMRISPHLKIKDAEDKHRKLVHRELALKKGISREIAYREKSRAQDGTGVHDMIRSLAEKHFVGKKFNRVGILDYGSNYRYLKEEYATPATTAFLEEISRKNNVDFLATRNEDL
jgi:asparagine synthase (glutamine-hydrolysing)